MAVPSAIFLFALLAFWPCLRNGWVNFDDTLYILTNPYLNGLNWGNLRWMATSFAIGDYVPLTHLSWAIDETLWGLRPFGFHLTNLLLHGLNAVLFYFLALDLLKKTLSNQPKQIGKNAPFWAALAALLFAVHPLRVESVAWISERKDVLCGSFYLLTLLFYFRSIDERNMRQRWYLASLGAFLCSLLAKGASMTLPIVLTLLDVYPLGRLSGNPKNWLGRKYRGIWAEKVPYWMLSATLIGLTSFALHSASGRTDLFRSLQEYGPTDRLAQAAYGLVFYLQKTLIPIRLSPLYELPTHLDLFSSRIFLRAIAIAGTTVLLIVVRKRWPAVLAAWIFYVVTLFPTLGILQFGVQLVACRYSYLACLVWPLLLVGILAKYRNMLPATAALSIFLVATFATLSWRETAVWHDTMSLFQRALEVEPNNRFARHSLGVALAEQGNFLEAGRQFEEILRLRLDDADEWSNLALTLSARGYTKESIAAYSQALHWNPRHADAHNNLGYILLEQHHVNESIPHFEKALEIRPTFAQAHKNLGIALTQLGRIEEARPHLLEASRLDAIDEYGRANLHQILLQNPTQ